ncbi:MAG: IS1634 family transposase [Actinomycetia bacterium]|nr:IS1634 family transposase [Actinomycetes bacterium]
MAHFHIKRKKGRPYLYVREMARIDGKPKVVSQIYIGCPDRVAALAKGGGQEVTKLSVEEFGALWTALQIDRDIDLAGIVDGVIGRGAREKSPTVGEYFLYCVLNRMVEAVSKNKLADWYARTAIQRIRPVEIGKLTSGRYWEKWERVGEEDLREIAGRFFSAIWEVESPEADCLLFDTTNYYTYMASNTESELARRGKNKDGKNHLRQVGLGLLVARGTGLPLYYRAYPGNLHDSHLFGEVMDEMFGVVMGLDRTKERLTVVLDKGMNSDDNYAWIDEHKRMHFVTTYSTYFAEELAQTPLDKFEPVDTEKNRRLADEGNPGERTLAMRTRGEYWGKERAVVVTYNPATARKQGYTLEGKLDTIRGELLSMRKKVKERAPHWRDPETIRERYLRLCERLHVTSDLFTLEFHETEGKLQMGFRKDQYRLKRKQTAFGKNIIITDNTDWTTTEIVEASLARAQVENQFRLSKDEDLVGTMPFRHWTDSKIRCHLFTCVVAMTYLTRLEIRLSSAGVNRMAEDVMDDMRHLHSVLTLTRRARKPLRRLETPTKTQSEVLTALGHHVDESGVLQPSRR